MSTPATTIEFLSAVLAAADMQGSRGRVVSIEVAQTEDDWSMTRDGHFTRWITVEGGTRLVRPRPPYWSNVGRVACCEIGESVTTRPEMP